MHHNAGAAHDSIENCDIPLKMLMIPTENCKIQPLILFQFRGLFPTPLMLRGLRLEMRNRCQIANPIHFI